jgi:TatD DNase family protein
VSPLPPLDLHAHIDAAISSADLEDLEAVIFAVTRSLREAQQALQREDRSTVWGVGCHPGLVGAQRDFSAETFSVLIDRTPFVGELGLDGKSSVPLGQQRANLRSAFEVLSSKPRIVSLHSYAATNELLDELEATPIRGVVLHWWLGDAVATDRAIQAGCYFSVNASSSRRVDLLRSIPTDRLLTETDHPFGDRRSKSQPAPGRVEEVERSFARLLGLNPPEVRRQIWRNLSRLTRDLGCSQLLPSPIRAWLAAVA